MTTNTSESLHQIFKRRAAQYPHRLAVSCGEEQLTYAALDAWAERIAAQLIRHGVGAQTIVPLHVDRSVELIVGLLAILKAGAAFLPVDSTLPPARVQWLIADCKAQVVVTTSRLKDSFAAAATLLLLDDQSATAAPCLPRVAHIAAGADSLAYVIYTSGSTGAPKGVMVEHRAVVALFEQAGRLFRFNERDVWTLFHSIGFDFSQWEIWGALLFGGHLVIPSFNATRSASALLALLRERRVTVLSQTPSAFRQFLPVALSADADALSALRTLFLGGERLNVAILTQWLDRHGERVAVINLYGPTEATIFASFRTMGRDDLESAEVSPIGSPFPGYEFSVVDTNGVAVADGEAGELCIGGTGVARGYFNRLDLTAARFIDSADGLGGRRYRTGDRVARQAGEYIYFGRLDDQIKVRGFRVEPGEIEACIGAHPLVHEAAVIAHDYGEGDVRLLAYVALMSGISTNWSGADGVQAQLSAHCTAALPVHMRPSLFTLMAALPMTMSGKLDRAALPRPQSLEKRARPVAGVSATQAKVAAICSEVLQVQDVGLDDDFVSLGGTSIAAVRMLLGINRLFDTDFDVAMLATLEKATVANIAALVDEEIRSRVMPATELPA